jgi:hypothetical protein
MTYYEIWIRTQRKRGNKTLTGVERYYAEGKAIALEVAGDLMDRPGWKKIGIVPVSKATYEQRKGTA